MLRNALIRSHFGVFGPHFASFFDPRKPDFGVHLASPELCYASQRSHQVAFWDLRTPFFRHFRPLIADATLCFATLSSSRILGSSDPILRPFLTPGTRLLRYASQRSHQVAFWGLRTPFFRHFRPLIAEASLCFATLSSGRIFRSRMTPEPDFGVPRTPK